MLVPLLIGLTLVLCAGPIRTARVYELAWRRQNAQIGVDNAAIVLGRADRALFRSIAVANRLLSGLELAHHTAHACARVPGPQRVACRASDTSLELTIRSIHQSVGEWARAGWKTNPLLAHSAAGARGVRLGLQRQALVPLRAKRCPICRLENAWEAFPRHPRTGIFRVDHPGTDVVESHLTETTRGWNYELGESR